MMASILRSLGVGAAVALCLMGPASAQVLLNAPGLVQKNAPPPPPVRALPTVWPRLDPGAVLCHTADDLDRHAANMTAKVSGGDTFTADCQIVAQPIGIQIISREGLGRTQVKVNGSNVTGWTDAWLPNKAPPTR